MTFSLGAKSLNNLNGVHPILAGVVRRAIQLSTQDFTVFEGLRTLAAEQHDIDIGTSHLHDARNCKHCPQPDGYGHAVDLVPWVDGRAQWLWPAIYAIAQAMQQAAAEAGLALTWGGAWDRSLGSLGADMKAAHAAYVIRHPHGLMDGPHFELA